MFAFNALFQGTLPDLNTLRSTTPQPPNSYQQTGSLPGQYYDDPKPTVTNNYDRYLTQLVQPGNATGVAGSLPLQSVDPTSGSAMAGGFSSNLDSRNYNFTAPVLSLPGRAGMNLGLALSYNSKVWTKDSVSNTMAFNADRGFPAPGWRLGFGALQIKDGSNAYYNNVTGKYALIYIAPDGTRHDLSLTATPYVFTSYDSSYLKFHSVDHILSFPNGTKMLFGAFSYDSANRDFQALPTRITDRNGNFITISYKTLDCQPNGSKTVIDYIIDTAGRRIDFVYNNNRLTSIKQTRGGGDFYFLRIDYQAVQIQTDFNGMTLDPATITNSDVYFPSRITYPTGVNYRFSYTSYGQVTSISKWVPGIPDQGSERSIATTTLNMPILINGPQSDCPAFTTRSEQAENSAGGTYHYTYAYSIYPHTIVDPSDRMFKIVKTNLAVETQIYKDTFYQQLIKTTRMDYADDGLSYRSNPRVIDTRITDEQGTVRRMSFVYSAFDGIQLPVTKNEWIDNGATLYRSVSTTYQNYSSQYLYGLPLQVSVYAEPSHTLAARTLNNYDQTTSYNDSNGQTTPYFKDATSDAVIQHDAAYGAAFIQRGNLTSVTQYSVTGGSATSPREISHTSYDTNGNLRYAADGLKNRKEVSYADNYFDKPGGVGQTGVAPTLTKDPTGFGAGVQLLYYSGNVRQSYNKKLDNSTDQLVETIYDFADRPKQTTRPDSGWVKTAYWDNLLATSVSQLIDSGQTRYNFDVIDGAGRVYYQARCPCGKSALISENHSHGGKNMVENRSGRSTSNRPERKVPNHGRIREDTQDRSRRSRNAHHPGEAK